MCYDLLSNIYTVKVALYQFKFMFVFTEAENFEQKYLCVRNFSQFNYITNINTHKAV